MIAANGNRQQEASPPEQKMTTAVLLFPNPPLAWATPYLLDHPQLWTRGVAPQFKSQEGNRITEIQYSPGLADKSLFCRTQRLRRRQRGWK